MAVTRAWRRILPADDVIAEGVTPQLVEGSDSELKQRSIAVLPALILAVLAGRLALTVDLVDLGDNFGNGALIGPDFGKAHQRPFTVVDDVGQAGACWRLAVALKDSSGTLAVANGGGVNLLKNCLVGDVSANKAKQLF
eukprot:1088392-Pleurochrysis_carterae.AAC.2